MWEVSLLGAGPRSRDLTRVCVVILLAFAELTYSLGYGVVLSATWLLPIAPIPGTWEECLTQTKRLVSTPEVRSSTE